MKRIVILGGGTGGTMTANRLRRPYGRSEAEIIVVDRDDRHVYQPGLLFVPFGLADPASSSGRGTRQLRDGIIFRAGRDRPRRADRDRVHLDDGTVLGYDVLVVATGARLLPEETDGLTGPGWMKSVFTFYTPDGAAALRAALERFTGGRLVVNVVDMPIKCPVAPLEFCFLADWYFRAPGHPRPGRDHLRRRRSTARSPSRSATGNSAACSTDKGIELVTEFNTGEVGPRAGRGAAA